MQMMPGSEKGREEEREGRRERGEEEEKNEKLKGGEGGMGWMKGESERRRKVWRVEEDWRQGQRDGWKEGRK